MKHNQTTKTASAPETRPICETCGEPITQKMFKTEAGTFRHWHWTCNVAAGEGNAPRVSEEIAGAITMASYKSQRELTCGDVAKIIDWKLEPILAQRDELLSALNQTVIALAAIEGKARTMDVINAYCRGFSAIKSVQSAIAKAEQY